MAASWFHILISPLGIGRDDRCAMRNGGGGYGGGHTSRQRAPTSETCRVDDHDLE
ncbi:hypothetical protein [Flexivirga endophytica]|uniref:hypothetical protein n=1 Tax=Flexivirga endophytica TaxID=1849103 RepID=UPI00166BB03E|nr:hypothetical protein [Flexivirga endophytica]